MAEKSKYILELYIAGQLPNSIRAIENLNKILSDELKGLYELKIIDVLKNPQLAKDEKILVTPTLARVVPGPIKKRVIGDLGNKKRVLAELDLF